MGGRPIQGWLAGKRRFLCRVVRRGGPERLVEWCGADIADFFEAHEKAAVTTDVIAEHLRSDRNLPLRPRNESPGS